LAVTVEQDIAERIAAARLRLRFDKVVLRLVGRLKASLADMVPEGQAVIFTVTAPIKVPGRTAAALERLVRDGLPDGHTPDIIHGTIHGNQVRLRRVTGLAAGRPKVVGFVHNPDPNADLILSLAEQRLRETD
jgi:predicted phosphohydrolase